MKTPAHTFRKDINGLRAVAVISVLLFHLFSYLKFQQLVPDSDWFSGGFVGVDIFFVISGFLMTAIIVRRQQNNAFSVWEFWKSRASRICPALLAVVILVMLVGFVIQIPHTYRETSRESMRALLFISNFWFARDQGYFAESAVDKTLLHTWSLSVEWQFYLIYPLLLILWRKIFSGKYIPHFVGALFVISLAVSFLLPNHDSSYFMLHTRAWELLIGGLIFLLPPLRLSLGLKRGLEISALTVIFLNVMLVRPMLGWEPLLVLPATLACALLLWLDLEKSLLSNCVFQYVGKISYSMYLIHWPVIAICFKLGLLNQFIWITLFIFIYAAVSYHLIETKRKWHWIILIVYFALIGLAQAEVKNDGKTLFNNAMGNESYHERFYGGRGIPERGNIYTGKLPGKPQLVIAGDSYARQYANFLNETIPFTGIFSDAQLHFNGVYIIGNFEEHRFEYSELYYKNLIRVLKYTSANSLILAHNWKSTLFFGEETNGLTVFPTTSRERLEAVIKGIHYLADEYPSIQIFVIGQPIRADAVSHNCILLKNSQNWLHQILFNDYNCPHYMSDSQATVKETNDYLRKICDKRNNIHFVDPNQALCHNGRCLLIDDNDLLVFSDGGHLSLSGAQIVGNYILKQINQVSHAGSPK